MDAGSFTAICGDLVNPVAIDGEVSLVFHCASPASPVDYTRSPIATLKVGAIGTMNALELARERRARFVLASTSEVYGEPLMHPQTEDYWGNVNPVGPRSMYDEAKRFAEALTVAYRRTAGVDAGIVRIFNTYGPRMRSDDGRVIPTFVSQALRGDALTIAGRGEQTRSFCYVDDMINAFLKMALDSLSGPVNLGNPHEVSVLELANLIRALVGGDLSLSFVERPREDPSRRQPDIAFAREYLGWIPAVGLEKGLMQTIDWFRSSSSGW